MKENSLFVNYKKNRRLKSLTFMVLLHIEKLENYNSRVV